MNEPLLNDAEAAGLQLPDNLEDKQQRREHLNQLANLCIDMFLSKGVN
ncbi:MAG: hypothetical protein ABSA33_02140 [Candidatus Micrarchaeaceae archaeon]|jgi:hypothetical protein